MYNSIMKNKTRGFTIVELLIVIVIIAILAAITLVAYNGITNRSKLARVQSDYSNIDKAIAMYVAEQGVVPLCSGGAGAGCAFSTIIPGLTQYSTGLPTKTINDKDILYAADTTGNKWGVRLQLPDGSYCKQGANPYASWWSPISACWD